MFSVLYFNFYNQAENYFSHVKKYRNVPFYDSVDGNQSPAQVRRDEEKRYLLATCGIVDRV